MQGPTCLPHAPAHRAVYALTRPDASSLLLVDAHGHVLLREIFRAALIAPMLQDRAFSAIWHQLCKSCRVSQPHATPSWSPDGRYLIWHVAGDPVVHLCLDFQ